MEDIKIEAVVEMNDGYAYVLNRDPVFKYQYVYTGGKKLLYAQDGGFYSCFYYDTPSGRFYAFAGRKFTLPLIDGGEVKCYGQWWDGGMDLLCKELDLDLTPITTGLIEELKKCYVYTGGRSIDNKVFEYLKSQYKGAFYEYRDYEKVIKFNDTRRALWRQISKLEKDKKNLIKQVKEKHRLLTK